MAGHPAPRGQIGGRAAVERDELHDLPRLHAGQSGPELEDELAAAEIAGVPGLIRLDVCAHDGVDVVPGHMETSVTPESESSADCCKVGA